MRATITRFPYWMCSACGYSGGDETKLRSYPGKCPKCGEERTSTYYGPRREHPWVDWTSGHYDFAHPQETQFQYRFRNLNGCKTDRRSFVVDEEIDTEDMTVLEVAQKLEEIIHNHLYNSDRDHITTVAKYLARRRKKIEAAEELYQIDHAEWKLWQAYVARQKINPR